MTTGNDELRRALRAADAEHAAAMPRFRRALSRLFDVETPEAAAARQELVLPGLGRRRFFRIGGMAVASAAVLAACGDTGEDAGPEATTTTQPRPTPNDITVLRTAASIENLAVQVYTRAIEGGLLTTPTVKSAATLFRDQHEDHADLLNGQTVNAGGTAFTQPNPALLQQLMPTIQGLRDERGVVQLAYDLELTAAATYQASAGRFGAARLNETMQSIGGVEMRHATILAAVLGTPTSPKAQATTEKAVTATV